MKMRNILDSGTEPIVTAVITTYNRAELLKRAVKSVLSQSYTNLEIVVVDDASPNDDTSRLIAELNDERIHLIKHEVNKGVSAARNTGIKNARGIYVAFLDDDDIWLEDKINIQLEVIKDDDSFAVTSAYYVSKNNEYYYVQKVKQSSIRLSDMRHGSLYTCSGLMVRKDYAERVLFDEAIGHGEDWDFFIRLSNLKNIKYLERPLFIQNDGNHQRITNKVKQKYSPDEIKYRLEQLDKHSEYLGKYWRKYHEVCLYLGYIGKKENRFKLLFIVAKEHGIKVTMHVLFNKVIKNLRILLSKRRITKEKPDIYRYIHYS